MDLKIGVKFSSLDPKFAPYPHIYYPETKSIGRNNLRGTAYMHDLESVFPKGSAAKLDLCYAIDSVTIRPQDIEQVTVDGRVLHKDESVVIPVGSRIILTLGDIRYSIEAFKFD